MKITGRKKLSLAILAAGLFHLSCASAEMILSDQKISISGVGQSSVQDLKKWSEDSIASVHAVCSEVAEMPHSFICAFKSKMEMNDSLIRIGFFNGTASGYPKGTLISNNNPTLNAYKAIIAGHTVTSDDFNSFGQAASASPDLLSRFNTLESDFYSNIIGNSKFPGPNSKYIIIAFANGSNDIDMVVRHEINHAKYYLKPGYKQTVLDFWKNNVSDIDKAEIRSVLGRIYNAEDDNIIIDEFQAYLMEGEDQANPLAPFIAKYKLDLITRLGPQ